MGAREKVIRAVVGQFGRPHGLAGRLAGWEMALRPSNRKRNAWAVSLLDIRTADRILEIGFGPGIAIKEAARRATDGYVAGVDHSPVMVRQATRRNARSVRDGRVDLRVGSADDLPTFDGPFDKVLAVNSIGFWREPVERLRDLHALARAGGIIAIVSQPRCPGASAEDTDIGERDIRDQLAAAGFSVLRSERLELDPPVVCVLASA